ncbi:hypothetical protein gpAD87_27605 [Paenibacillus sp. AD87]|nr:hypothetical protein gpAD87_27605 [Paenibacillus sp. AD87]
MDYTLFSAIPTTSTTIEVDHHVGADILIFISY